MAGGVSLPERPDRLVIPSMSSDTPQASAADPADARPVRSPEGGDARPVRSPARGDARLGAALLFLLSMVTLMLQVVQTRVFSYSINPVFVYMVVSLALLGFGLSGTVMSLVPKLRRLDLIRTLAACLLLFAIGAVVANATFARLSGLITPATGLSLLSPVVPLFLLFTVPYFFAGLGVGLVLLSDAQNVSRNYFINLLGSAAGCFAIYPFLSWLGAERIILGIALLCAAVSTGVMLRHARSWLPVGAVATFALALGWLQAERSLPFQPDRADQLVGLIGEISQAERSVVRPNRVFARWDPVGRIELFQFPGKYQYFGGRAPALFFAQDAGAASHLLGVGEHPDLARDLARGSFYGLATTLRPGADALVIGLGGGPDLVAALAAGAGKVTAVEINEAVVDLLGVHYREFLGLPPPGSERFELIHADGRGFVRQFRDRFDVIQMTGADTYAASAVAGSLLSENYLYTREAFIDFLQALEPDGLLAMTRFSLEPIKGLTTMIEALRAIGVEHPEEHVVVMAQGGHGNWVTTLVRKTPFPREEIAQIKRFAVAGRSSSERLSLPIFETIHFGFSDPLEVLYHPGIEVPANTQKGSLKAVLGDLTFYRTLFDAAARDDMETWLGQHSYDFSPTSDDKPFFFQIQRLRWPPLGQFFSLNPIKQYEWDVTQYLVLIFQIALVSLVLILGPLVVLKSRGQSLRAATPLAAFFFAIGVGFVLIEIGLMQKCTLFLGHPNYSISTILFSLLVFSGLGSYTSGRWNLSARATIGVATASIVSLVFAFAALSQPLFEATLTLPIGARIAIAVVTLAPLSFFMGMMFPTCLRAADEHVPTFSPWVWGVNGFASVLGSLSTIPLTLAIGFTKTLMLAAVAYALAWLSFEIFRRRVAL